MEVVGTLPRGRALTVADLESMPDDGHRYELIDGALIVTPAPNVRHQMVSGELYTLLRAGAPADLVVLTAPLDVTLSPDTAVQPDLLVARRDQFADANLPVAPMLAVEILSPSTRLVDLNLKRAAYERAGVASYWVVDPGVPRLVAWELQDQGFVQVADVAGSATFATHRPFKMTLTPADLIA
jgi:Uma2 family endonuclease